MADDDTHYELVDPFDVDNGELDGIHPAECFALGVEWAAFRGRLLGGKPFADVVLANNAVRLVALAERHGRFVEHCPGESGWCRITVGGRRDD